EENAFLRAEPVGVAFAQVRAGQEREAALTLAEYARFLQPTVEQRGDAATIWAFVALLALVDERSLALDALEAAIELDPSAGLAWALLEMVYMADQNAAGLKEIAQRLMARTFVDLDGCSACY